MNENKKYSINNMLLAFITFLGVVGLIALTGFFLLTPPDDIIMGQAEATQVRISGKVPGRIEAYRFSAVSYTHLDVYKRQRLQHAKQPYFRRSVRPP